MMDEKAKPRRPYVKPRIRVIELVAEEVLTLGCKNSQGASAKLGNPECGIYEKCAGTGS